MVRRAFPTVVGLFLVAIAVLAFAARLVPISNHIVLFFAALSPYLMLGALLSAFVLLLFKQWLLSTIASGLTIAFVATQIPLFMPEKHAGDVNSIRVVAANLYFGQADMKSIVAAARADADVLALTELTLTQLKNLLLRGK